MITIKVDRSVCQGYGNCALASADIFDLGDDGLVTLKADHADGANADAVRRAVYDCPTEAISVEDAGR